jgi:hypothetical protein
MKKILAALLAAMLIFAVGCPDPSSSSSTPSTPDLTASDYLSKGIKALSLGDYDSALYNINLAYETDTENAPEIALWKSLAILASTALSTEVQDIATAAGMTSFPTTLNDLMQGNYQDEMSVLTAMTYADYYGDFSYSTMPEISLPIAVDFNDLDNGELEGDDSNILNIKEYSYAILYNLGHSYSTGVTEPLTAMTNLMTGAVDDVIDCLSAVDTTTNIALTTDLLLPGASDSELMMMGWPTSGSGFAEYVIGEAEFLAVIGALEVINTFFNYSLSVSYDADLTKLTEVMVDAIANDGTISDTTLLPDNPMSGMLASHGNTNYYLGEAKASLSSALEHLSSAGTQISARTANDSPFAISRPGLGAILWDDSISGILNMTVDYINDVKASLDDTDKTMTITDIPMAGTIEVNISALFDQSILDPANYIEMDSYREPVIYDLGTDLASSDKVTSSTTISSDHYYAVKATDYTFGGLLVMDKADMTTLLDTAPIPYSVGDGDSYYIGGIPAEVILSMITPKGETATLDSATIDGADSFYWAMVLNPKALSGSKE